MNFTVDDWVGKPGEESPALPGRLDLVLLRDYCNELVNSVDSCFMMFYSGIMNYPFTV